MTVQVDAATGRRSAGAEFEVHGTPEQVWQALTTANGISCWYQPTELEVKDGVPVSARTTFGPGMEVTSAVTKYEPLRVFAWENQGWAGSPALATEWHITAKSGDTCTIRVVHSLFASTDEWDNQLEGAAEAMSGFDRMLQVYLKHFAGKRVAVLQLQGTAGSEDGAAWQALTSALGLHGATAGQAWSTPAGVPPLSGVVEYYSESPYDALVVLQSPPGVLALGAYGMEGTAYAALNIYHYDADPEASVERASPAWRAWFDPKFPAPAE